MARGARLRAAVGGYPRSLPGSYLIRRRVLATLVLAGALLLQACSSSAAPAAYVALGDSYSSGLGAGPYIDGSGHCLRSRRSWVYQLGRSVTSSRACAGATTSTVLSSQLGPFPSDTRLVTISIGGNDAGFADVLARCLLDAEPSCATRVAKAERFVRDELPGRLRRVYDTIRRRAPQATVVVAGYPRLLARVPWCGSVGEIHDGEQRLLNDASDLLARTIAAEVARRNGFRFADVRPAFAGGGVCARTPLIHGVAGDVVSSFHPNVAGYRAYAKAIKPLL